MADVLEPAEQLFLHLLRMGKTGVFDRIERTQQCRPVIITAKVVYAVTFRFIGCTTSAEAL